MSPERTMLITCCHLTPYTLRHRQAPSALAVEYTARAPALQASPSEPCRRPTTSFPDPYTHMNALI